MKASLQIGERLIFYRLTYSDRKTLGIAIHPDSSVEVKAPLNTSEEKIENVLRKRIRWILKQQGVFNTSPKHKALPKEYISGETHLYMGRQYRLKVVQIRNNETEEVKLIGSYICINSRSKSDKNRNKGLLDKWYKKHCQDIFTKHFDSCHDKLKGHGIKKPLLQIKNMKNRWGSFTNTDKIILNPQLIKLPSYCIDYVITHELCHVKYANHSRKFYNFLTLVMPDWQERKKKLETI